MRNVGGDREARRFLLARSSRHARGSLPTLAVTAEGLPRRPNADEMDNACTEMLLLSRALASAPRDHVLYVNEECGPG